MIASVLRNFALLLLVCNCLALPLNRDNEPTGKSSDESGAAGASSNSGSDSLFREVSRTSDENGCKITFTVTLFETKVRYIPENGRFEKYNDTYERNDTKCCDGWTNLPYCNERTTQGPPNVCGGLTCDADPTAECAIIKTKCGKEVPVFFDENGQVSTKCNLTEEVSSTLSCTGFCQDDPCKGVKCPAYPDGEAVCFTSGCDCKPVWFLMDGIEVDCFSGEHVLPEQSRLRRRRSASGSGDGCPS